MKLFGFGSEKKPDAPLNQEGLILQAAHLRDHLLRTKDQDCTSLTMALQPFQTDHRNDPSDDELITLVDAFQSAYDNALGSLDERTLINVLNGNSPFQNPARRGSTITLVLLGVFLVVGAFHYTLWSNKAVTMLRDVERFSSFQHLDAVFQALDQRSALNQSAASPPNAATTRTSIGGPDFAYMQLETKLRNQYQLEYSLPVGINTHLLNFNPFGKWFLALRREYCARHTPRASISSATAKNPYGVALMNCPRARQQVNSTKAAKIDEDGESGSVELMADRSDNEDAIDAEVARSQNDFDALPTPEEQFTNIQFVRQDIAKVQAEAGRYGILTPYEASRSAVESLKRELNQRLNVVRYWALPMIYGALGALVYSMWCVLTPSVSSLGFWHPIMRMIFGALAALTFSMILVPANVLSVGLEAQTPLVYLLSFIFGYSVEGFVRLLNVLNAYIASNTVVKSGKST